jgi:elongation factor P--(R)-beta-lysine ligase
LAKPSLMTPAPDLKSDDQAPFRTARQGVIAASRGWFGAEGFAEVETLCLVPAPGAEVHLNAFQVGDHYLRTSPEFAHKRLLADGAGPIFELARVWRQDEIGPLHSPEFTLAEWYRPHAPYSAVMDDCVALCRRAAEATGQRVLAWRGRSADPFAPPEHVTVADAFRTHAHIDLVATLEDRDALAAAARAIGVRVAADDDWSDLFSRILVERVEPKLGQGRLTLLYEYPLAEAALAQRAADPRFAERFELYACGVELANGYGELIDADEQRARYIAAMDERERRYGTRYPIDEAFLTAIGRMPPASGCALGLDRLVLLASHGRSIQDVLP